MGKSWRSPDIYTPQMEAHWAKVLGAARRREDTDPAAWSIDLVADPTESAGPELIKDPGLHEGGPWSEAQGLALRDANP